MTKRVLIIMARAPRLGAVKSRLARDIGPLKAWRFYRNTLAATVRNLTNPGAWRTVLQITPDRDLSAKGQWPKTSERLKQGQGGLGIRMERGLTAFGRGVPVVLIGSDIPAVSPGHIRQAFQALGAADVVFGPATDGGYWLVGFANRRPTRHPFHNVRWSSPNALKDTLANFKRRKTATIETLSDVDDGKSYGNSYDESYRR
jgi:hypothetical protein